MFNLDLEGTVRGIAASAKDDDGLIVRTDAVSFCFEFSSEVASALGKDGSKLQKMLSDCAIKGAELEFDEKIEVTCTDNEGSEIRAIGRAQGLKLKRAKEDEEDPIATLKLVTAIDDDNHVWFVHHLFEVVAIRIAKAQGELPGVE